MLLFWYSTTDFTRRAWEDYQPLASIKMRSYDTWPTRGHRLSSFLAKYPGIRKCWVGGVVVREANSAVWSSRDVLPHLYCKSCFLPVGNSALWHPAMARPRHSSLGENVEPCRSNREQTWTIQFKSPFWRWYNDEVIIVQQNKLVIALWVNFPSWSTPNFQVAVLRPK